jgi:hypothetical protein
MAYDFTSVVNQMRGAGVDQAEIDAFLQEQQKLELEFQASVDTTKATTSNAFTAAQAEISAMLAKEQESIAAQQAAFEASQAQAQAQAAAVAAQVQAQQEQLAKQQAEAEAKFAANAEAMKRDIEGMQRESAEKIAGRRRARRSAAGRDSLINAAAGAGVGSSVPTLGTQGVIGAVAAGLGSEQKLGVGG